MPSTPNLGFIGDYWIDAWQRSILTLDALRQRGNTYFEQAHKIAPNVLDFETPRGRPGGRWHRDRRPATAHRPCPNR
jgi:hypothetical protein